MINKILKFFAKNKLILTIIIIGFYLRLLYFKDITFGYDMARDALESISIWKSDPVKLIGPGTDIPGVDHGVLYWYLISPLYYFTNGSIFFVKFVLVIFSLLNIPLIYYFSKKLFANEKVALLSAFIFSISFEAISYSRWVIHAAQAVFAIGATYLGIWMILKKKSLGIPFAIFFALCATHFQFFNVYLLGFIFLATIYGIFFQKIRPSRKDFILLIPSLILVAPFILKEIKFHFRIVTGLLGYLNHGGPGFITRIPSLPSKFFEKISEVFYYNFFSFNFSIAKILAAVFFIYFFFDLYKEKKLRLEKLFLLCWILSLNFLYLLEGFNAYFINIGIIFPLIILLAFYIFRRNNNNLFKKIFISITIFTIAFSNLSLVFKHNQHGEWLFSIQKRNIISDKYEIIDAIYKDANKQQFKINTVTEPLFINSVWSFLFNYYGKSKYGYMPQWAGFPQDGERVYGKEIEFAKYNENTKILYLIQEPTEGLPESYIKAYQKFENTRSKLLWEKKFGNHILQKRQLFNNTIFLRDEVFKYALEK